MMAGEGAAMARVLCGGCGQPAGAGIDTVVRWTGGGRWEWSDRFRQSGGKKEGLGSACRAVSQCWPVAWPGGTLVLGVCGGWRESGAAEQACRIGRPRWRKLEGKISCVASKDRDFRKILLKVYVLVK